MYTEFPRRFTDFSFLPYADIRVLNSVGFSYSIPLISHNVFSNLLFSRNNQDRSKWFTLRRINKQKTVLFFCGFSFVHVAFAFGIVCDRMLLVPYRYTQLCYCIDTRFDCSIQSCMSIHTVLSPYRRKLGHAKLLLHQPIQTIDNFYHFW